MTPQDRSQLTVRQTKTRAIFPEGKPEGEMPVVAPGEDQMAFACVAPPSYRARVLGTTGTIGTLLVE